MRDLIILGGPLFAVVIGSLVSAVVLRAAAKWVQNLDVPYGQAYITVLLPGLITVILCPILLAALHSATQLMEAANPAALLLMVPVGFLILSGFISLLLEIPFSRACLVALAMAAIGFAMVVILAIPITLIRVSTG